LSLRDPTASGRATLLVEVFKSRHRLHLIAIITDTVLFNRTEKLRYFTSSTLDCFDSPTVAYHTAPLISSSPEMAYTHVTP
jgi:hypothetical protein